MVRCFDLGVKYETSPAIIGQNLEDNAAVMSRNYNLFHCCKISQNCVNVVFLVACL